MNWKIISSVLISAVVIAAVITSFINFVIAVLNSCMLKKIEKERQINSINQYRYKELHSILADWINISISLNIYNKKEIINYNEHLDYLNQKTRLLEQKYKIAYSLIDKELIEKLENDFKKVYNAADNCFIWMNKGEQWEKIYSKKEYKFLSEYEQCCNVLCKEFERIVNLQLQKILFVQNKIK